MKKKYKFYLLCVSLNFKKQFLKNSNIDVIKIKKNSIIFFIIQVKCFENKFEKKPHKY